jgi:hypothetical protein
MALVLPLLQLLQWITRQKVSAINVFSNGQCHQ